MITLGCLREMGVSLGQGGGETLQLSQGEGKGLPVQQQRRGPPISLPRSAAGRGVRTLERTATQRELTMVFIGCDSIQREHTRRPPTCRRRRGRKDRTDDIHGLR